MGVVSNLLSLEIKFMERRSFLKMASLGLPLTALSSENFAGAQTSIHSSLAENVAEEGRQSLITRERSPENLETPFSSLHTLVTSNEQFYVRSHFAVPQLDSKTWRLKVEGTVKTPLELSLQDLIKMPSRTVPATLECAGNNRVFLVPAARGAQWGLGAISNAEWTGVPLFDVLQRAGISPQSVEVILEGADSGEIKESPKPTGAIHYARSLPLDRARQPEVLLAYQMNGKELPASHGFPLRAVVPGWYGMASVKWLTRLVVVEKPFNGYFQSVDYALWERPHGIPTRVPITEMQTKAQIARPDLHEVVAAGSVYRVFGAAWTGDSDIAKVEFSEDGGKTWTLTQLLEKPVRHTWSFWEYRWSVPTSPGKYALMARATDKRGNVQPMQRQPDLENYVITHVIPVEIEVR